MAYRNKNISVGSYLEMVISFDSGRGAIAVTRRPRAAPRPVPPPRAPGDKNDAHAATAVAICYRHQRRPYRSSLLLYKQLIMSESMDFYYAPVCDTPQPMFQIFYSLIHK